MIQSMTAFARAQQQGEWGSLVCEIRSVNHRYLEISLHLPDVLKVLEMPIRERVRNLAKRGKIECTLRYQASLSSGGDALGINRPLAAALCNASEAIAAMLAHPHPISPTDILRFPGVLESKEADFAELQTIVFGVLDLALEELIAARSREGSELNHLFMQRLDGIQTELAKVKERLPQILTEQRERMLRRFNEVKSELDPSRLEQEMVLFAHRMDVAEEIERAQTHVVEIKRNLKQGGLVGRRLDFLLQELNREANTLGSKSTDPEVTQAAVEIKVLIEQVREQVQNVE